MNLPVSNFRPVLWERLNWQEKRLCPLNRISICAGGETDSHSRCPAGRFTDRRAVSSASGQRAVFSHCDIYRRAPQRSRAPLAWCQRDRADESQPMGDDFFYKTRNIALGHFLRDFSLYFSWPQERKWWWSVGRGCQVHSAAALPPKERLLP